MRFAARIGCLGLAIMLGAGMFLGTGHAEIQGEKSEEIASASHSKPALAKSLLITNKEILDLSMRSTLFFSPNAGCREALQMARELPEEKRPYLVALSGNSREINAELEQAGLCGVKYYRCKGTAPTITVPSLVWVDGNVKKEYTCSTAVEMLREMKYPLLLARAELPNVPGPAGNNAIRAMMAINGVVVNPGEEFSFYGYVGVPSAERGYLPARSLMETPEGPAWIEDVGGGICKAATLLNNAVKKTQGLKITEQHHHTRPVTFAPEGQDIAVARSSGWDYRFKNSRERPVQIKVYWGDQVLKIEMWELAKTQN